MIREGHPWCVYKLSFYKDNKFITQTWGLDKEDLKRFGKKICKEHNLDCYRIEIDQEKSGYKGELQ